MTLLEKLKRDAPPGWRVSLTEPGFENSGKVHDWRNYIVDAAKSHWGELDDVAKLLLMITAEIEASREEWE